GAGIYDSALATHDHVTPQPLGQDRVGSSLIPLSHANRSVIVRMAQGCYRAGLEPFSHTKATAAAHAAHLFAPTNGWLSAIPISQSCSFRRHLASADGRPPESISQRTRCLSKWIDRSPGYTRIGQAIRPW